MTFLNMAFLWALPLVLAPVILHLVNKRPPKRLLFSHIGWIRAAHQSFMPRKRLRDLILMLLRALMLFFIILFFSRPIFHGGGVFSKREEDSAMVIVVDVSASMGAIQSGQTAFDVAREKLLGVLRQIPPSVKIGLVSISDKVEQEMAPTIERSQLTATIDSLKGKQRPTDMLPALELAYGMLSSQPSGRKSILIVSDLADHGWGRAKELAGRWEHFDPEVGVILWEVMGENGNIGISHALLQLSEEGWLKGRWEVHREGAVRSQENWWLKLNGRVVAQGDLAGLKEDVASFPLEAKLPEGGFYAGRIGITPDALPVDDTYYLAGRVPKGFRLLIVDGESGLAPSDAEAYYMRLALESPRDPRLESIRSIRPEVLSRENLDRYDAIVLANVGDLAGREGDLLEWIERGGGLFFSAGSKWPSSSKDPLGVFRLKPALTGKYALIQPDGNQTFLDSVEELGKFEWAEIQVHKYIPLQPDSSAVPILKLRNGDPFLVKKQMGKGFILCLTSTLDRSWTNFPAKPVFAPLIRELMATLADPYREQTSLMGVVNKPFRVRMPAGVKSATIITPDGSSGGAKVDDEGFLNWASPSVPGLYQVHTNNKETDFKFAINLSHLKEEGTLRRLPEGAVNDIFPKSSVEWVGHGGQSIKRVMAALQGKDLTRFLMILVMGLFLIETFLSWPRKIRGAIVLLLLGAHGLGTLAWAGEGNNFVYAQLKHKGAWDPYPLVYKEILNKVTQMTNIPHSNSRKIVELRDESLFESTFLLIKGNSPLLLEKNEKKRLKQFINRGGFVLADDTLGEGQGAFSESIRALMSELFPDRPFKKIPMDHALFRSFFLLRKVAGRRLSNSFLQGLDVGGTDGGEGRTAVVLCSNDLLGAWMKDHLGHYAYSCEPGGESQRWESFKLTINLIYFSLTGTYKKDAIHQPFIERKLGL